MTAKIPAPVGIEINAHDQIHAATQYLVTAEQAPAVFRKLAAPARFFLHASVDVRGSTGDEGDARVTFKVPRASALKFIEEACIRGDRVAITIYKESPHLAFIG